MLELRTYETNSIGFQCILSKKSTQYGTMNLLLLLPFYESGMIPSI